MDKTKESEIYSKETIKIHIKDTHSNNPIVNAKVTLLAMGQKTGQKIPLDTPTDSNGEVLFNSKPYLKDINRFEITIEHTDYYTYPKNRVRKLCRSYEYGHLCEERFEKIPSFYYNGTTLAISPKINPFQKYSLKTQSLKSQAKQEYYIQLQENQKSLTIYKDRNLTQESGYTLYLGTQNTQAESTPLQSNTTTILNFESKESLERFTKDIQELIIKDKKKGNAKLVHRFVVGIKQIRIIAKDSKFIDTIKKDSQTLTYFQIHSPHKIKKLVYDRAKIQSIIKTKDIESIQDSLQEYPTQTEEFDYKVNEYEKGQAVLLFACDESGGISFERGHFVQLGFEAIDVAKFIIDEMRTNVASKEAKEIENMLEIERTLIEQSPANAIGLFTPAGKAFAMSSKIQSLWKFREIIDTDKPWDHKPQIRDLFPTMGLSTPFYHRYIHNGKHYEISYDIWSNIHFGYIGKAIGFWEWLLKKGADWAQNGFFGDDPKDKAAIDIGFQLYDTYKENLSSFTAEQLLDIILANKRNLNIKEIGQ